MNKKKGYKLVSIMGSYAAEKEGKHDGLPVAEVEGDRDEDDMAVFGKRQQLKVRFSRVAMKVGALISNDKRNFGFFSMVGLTCTLMATWEGLFSYVFVFRDPRHIEDWDDLRIL